MDIDGVADELYGVAPERFITVRTEREREARSAGDRDLAARIRQLAKPTTVAWLANSLVRARRTEIEPLLELGAGLRAASATLDGELLRELDRQQHRVVHALVEEARRVAGQAGRTVSEDTARALEDTLHAALADETAADQLSRARLTDALHRDTGFPPAGAGPRLTSVPTGRSARTEAALRTSIAKGGAGKGRAVKAERAEHDRAVADEAARKAEEHRRAVELELARRAEQRAQLAARTAAEARDRARVAAGRAEKATHEGAAAVERLRAELEAATTEHSRLEAAHTDARTALEQTESDSQEADRVLADATKRREQLSTSG